MSLSDDVKTVLTANAPLMAVLTGGVYTRGDVGEISQTNTPAAYDANKELKPCALIGQGTEIKRGGIDDFTLGVSVQTPVIVYFYERSGYDNIDAAMNLAFPLLNAQKIGSSTWRVEFDNEIRNQVDQALDCPLGVQRWNVVRRRA